MYYVYMILCEDNSLYTGITTDPKRRFKEHQSSSKGAKYTRVHKPVKLVYVEEAENRSEASKREYAIKQLKKDAKLQLIQEYKHNYSQN